MYKLVFINKQTIIPIAITVNVTLLDNAMPLKKY